MNEQVHIVRRERLLMRHFPHQGKMLTDHSPGLFVEVESDETRLAVAAHSFVFQLFGLKAKGIELEIGRMPLLFDQGIVIEDNQVVCLENVIFQVEGVTRLSLPHPDDAIFLHTIRLGGKEELPVTNVEMPQHPEVFMQKHLSVLAPVLSVGIEFQ